MDTESMDATQPLPEDQASSEQTHFVQARNLSIGTKFARPGDLKVAVELFYAAQGKGMKVGRGGSRQREFRCSGSMLKERTRENPGCQAVVRATKQSDNEWKISSMHTVHENCSGRNHKVSAATAGRIASLIIAATPKVSGKALKAAIENKTGGSLGLRAAYRAKCAALAEGRVGLEESYSLLRPYLAMLATRSPGTITDLEVSAASNRHNPGDCPAGDGSSNVLPWWKFKRPPLILGTIITLRTGEDDERGRRLDWKLVSNAKDQLDVNARSDAPWFCAWMNGQVEEDNTFRRCFVMLGKAVHIVTNSVLKLFAVNSYQLRGMFNGVMMTLSCKDADNKVVDVATAIVRREDSENYRYLLSNTKKNPNMRDLITSAESTCFATGHEGAFEALRSEAPQTQYRRCLKRIVDNIAGVGEICKEEIFEAARAPTRPIFDKVMDRVKALNPACHRAVMELPLEHWTHHASREDTVILDQVTSDFNDPIADMEEAEAEAEAETEMRKLPVFELVVEIVQSTSSKFAESESHGLDDSGEYTKFVMDAYRTELELSKEMTAFPLGNSMYMVQKATERFKGNRVTLVFDGEGGPVCICTCAFPARYKIPCRHVFAAAQVVGRVQDCVRFVDDGYGATKYRELHLDGRFPIVCPMIDELHRDPSLRPPQRVQHEQAGGSKKVRARKRRKRSFGESSSSSHRDGPMSTVNSRLERHLVSEVGVGLDTGCHRRPPSPSGAVDDRVIREPVLAGNVESVVPLQQRTDSQSRPEELPSSPNP